MYRYGFFETPGFICTRFAEVPGYILTNAQPIGNPRATTFLYAPGTGTMYYTSELKPAGPLSRFPYGFTPLPNV